MGVLAAAAGIAEPTRADPAVPSTRIAGMMIARLMRMAPPGNYAGQRPGGRSRRAHRPCWVYCQQYALRNHFDKIFSKRNLLHDLPRYLRVRCRVMCRELM
jgi:hypothetical protein